MSESYEKTTTTTSSSSGPGIFDKSKEDKGVFTRTKEAIERNVGHATDKASSWTESAKTSANEMGNRMKPKDDERLWALRL